MIVISVSIHGGSDIGDVSIQENVRVLGPGLSAEDAVRYLLYRAGKRLLRAYGIKTAVYIEPEEP